MKPIFLNIISCVSAFLAIYFQAVENVTLYKIFKPITTVLIILVPIFYGNKEMKKYLYSVVLALLFCLIGDVLLLDEGCFIFGLGAFLLGHVLFSYSFISVGGMKYYLIPLIVLLLISFAFYSIIKNSLGDLSLAVAAYILFIVFMCWQGVCLYLWKNKKVFLCIALATILFLISDSVLAINKFYHPFEGAGAVILITYWLSILILANSTVEMREL